MDMRHAARRADQMLDATFAAIIPEVAWSHHITTTSSCVVKRRRKIMTVISPQRLGSFLGVVQRHWTKSGYEITSVNKSRDMPAIFARSPDGFQLALNVGYAGQASFEVATPCVAKSPVDAPRTPPNGPAYPPGEIPTPNVHSAFWSAGTPLSSPSPSPTPPPPSRRSTGGP
ncbi:hypothetical protein M1O15_19070 [Streptomyces lichenis]|uniref:DUF4304 domain-containing protein n=1 Tax=Streptomyces lichenis TaxID=2306967 RepID=A0ABT0IDT6_9ACTN|nr:hypothetical protein [Streptomyces lichenis]